ncbi:hypothetical protein CC86DRAFT_371100 [Ophiobolus disseminans]|uniref:Uncharacterized protein n=1 Tax=Ophiobolus disseminans TaxID=1469910 RepID=A0A6A6ZX59_9PLEO|nr:hypothetical protein CC86DRAFT_371100 [Ophiobolus disseminans]
MAPSASTYADTSLLQWPFNPTGLFVNQTTSNRTSHTALVFEHGALPMPWPYVLASVSISFISAIFGYAGLLDSDSDEEQGFFSYFRKPGIVYNVFRTIAAIILCARVPQTRSIPSSMTTGSLAASLISQLVGWEDKIDFFSFVSIVGTTILLCLTIYQMVLGGAWGRVEDSPNAYGYGALRLYGGNCPRFLGSKEYCATLVQRGCGETGRAVGGLVGHVQIMSLFQTFAGGGMIICIAPLVLWTIWKAPMYYRRSSKHDEVSAIGAVTKVYALTFLSVMICFVATFARREEMEYVDASIGNDTGVWTSCFTAHAPKATYGFVNEWWKQEWNEANAMRVALLAFV